MPKFSKECTSLNLNFRRVGGLTDQKKRSVGGYGYFLEQHIVFIYGPVFCILTGCLCIIYVTGKTIVMVKAWLSNQVKEI